MSRRNRAVVPFVLGLLLGSTSCDEAAPERPELPDHPTAAVSLEEVAQRLAPLVREPDTDPPPDPCGDGSPGVHGSAAWPEQVLTYSAQLEVPNARMGVLVWLLPTAEEASAVERAYTEYVEQCPTRISESGSATGYIEAEFASDTAIGAGWSGVRSVLSGMSGPEETAPEGAGPFVEVDTFARRGPLLAAVEWHRDDEVATHEPPPEWRTDGMSEIAVVLDALGGDPANPTPEAPDAAAVSTKVNAGLPPPSAYHPAAEASDWSSPDLLCELPEETFPLPPGASYLERGVRARVETADERRTGEVEPVVTGTPDAVAVAEWITLLPTEEQATTYAAELQAEANTSPPPERPCSRYELVSSDGGFATADNPRESDPVELLPRATEQLNTKGWSGSLSSMAVRYVNAGPDAPTHESAAQVIVVATRGPVVVYLRLQTGAGDNLAAAVDRAKAGVLATLEALAV